MNNEFSGTVKKEKPRFSARAVAVTGITAAVYTVATLAIAPLGYGAIQLRFSEIMVLLAFIDRFGTWMPYQQHIQPCGSDRRYFRNYGNDCCGYRHS